MLDNPYKYFKSPPFDSVTLMVQRERAHGGVNTGVVYLQNAAPSGPTVWIVAATGVPRSPPVRQVCRKHAHM